MTQIAEAFVAIRPDSKGFQAETAKQIEPQLQNLKGLATKILGGLGVAAVIKGGIDELKQQQQVLAQTNVVIQATGGAAGVSAQQVASLAEETQKLSGMDKEAAQAGLNLLLQFKNVRNEVGAGNDIFNQASKAATDLAAANGIDLPSAYRILGRALEDPVQGTRALRQANVILSESQKAQIKQLEDQGKSLEAQKLVLDIIRGKVDGAAEAYGNTLPGKLERAKNSLDDLEASIVGAAAPAIEKLADFTSKVSDAFTKLPPSVQTGIIALGGLAIAAGPVQSILSNLGPIVARLGSGIETLALQAMYGVEGVAGLTGGLGPLGAAIGAVGLITAAGVISMKAFGDQHKENKQLTDEYATALQKESGAARDATDAITAKKLAEEGIVGPLQKAGISAKDFGDALRNSTADMKQFNDLRGQGTAGMEAYEHRFETGAISVNGFTQTLYDAIKAHRITSDEFNTIVYAMGSYSQSLDAAQGKTSDLQYAQAALGVTTDDTGNAISGQSDQLKELQDRLKKAADSAQKMLDANDKLTGSAIDAAKADLDFGDAVDHYRQKQADSASTTRDKQRALLDAQDAANRAAQATVDNAAAEKQAKGDTLSEKDAIDLKIQKLGELRDTLDPGSPLRQYLDSYIGQLQQARDLAAYEDLVKFANALASGDQKVLIGGQAIQGLIGKEQKPQMAEGGIVMPRSGGTDVTVAEAGKPEAIVPLDRAGILGGATITIYDARDPVQTAFRVRQELRSMTYGRGAA